ncbi:MAG TPA: hypothetical protein VH593_33380 [Ktedonobacteraceae bacterium]|jgi:hypothetical protein
MDDMYNERQNHHATQGKLVLSAPPSGAQPQSVSDETSFMPSGSLQNSFMPGGVPPFATGGLGYSPVQPKKNIFQKLRSDPAYQVLAIAIVVVLVASSALVAFAATGMGTNPNHTNQPIIQRQTTPTTRIALAPTAIPTPLPTTAPTQAPMPVTQPTQKPTGNLTVQFNNLPAQVMNNTDTQIVIQTNEPGAQVELTATYAGALGNRFVSGAQMTDNNGMATITWPVKVFVFGNNNNNNVTANLVATAMDNNGQIMQAQAMVLVIIK